MFLEICLFFVALFAWAYYEVTKQFDFFENIGLPYSKPSFPFGSKLFGDLIKQKVKLEDFDRILAAEFPGQKIYGSFAMGQPTFNINDEELAKHILIKDFSHFMDRRSMDFGHEIMNAFLTNLKGEEWKSVRSLMSGVFTSGKLKKMVPHLVQVGANFEDHISKQVGEELNMKDVGGLLTLDAIASTGFGIETNSFDDPNNAFRINALILTNAPGYGSKWTAAKFGLLAILPRLTKLLKISAIDFKVIDYFSNVVRQTYRSRIERNERRNDIIDIIIEELKRNKGQNVAQQENFESEFEKDAALDTKNITDVQEKYDTEVLLISNAILFFFAGFDTTSTGIALCCHYLSHNPDAQEQLYEEVMSVIGDDQEPTFDDLQNLKFMDNFIAESFRNFTLIPFIERVCTKDYKVPGTDVVIPKDRIVKVYTKGMAFMEDNFKNPDAFDPDNFAPENKPNKFAYTMFGQGPRNCVGMRYALLILKVFLVHLVRKHRVVKCSKTVDVPVLDPTNINQVKGGIFVKLEKRV